MRPHSAAPCSGGAALGVGAVDVGAGGEQQRDRLDRVLLRLAAAGHVLFAGGDVGGHHDRVDAVARRRLRVGALLEQQLDHRRVAGLGRAQQRRGAGAEHAVAAAIELRAVGKLRAQRRVDVGAVRQQLLDDVEAGQRRSSFASAPAGWTRACVCASTAAYSAVRPTLSAMLTSMPASISSAGDVEVAVDQREDERGVAVGIDHVDVGARVDERLARSPRSRRARRTAAA